MFEDSLVESSGRIKTKRGWTTFLSFGLQVLLVCVLILIPLIYTEALPKSQMMTFLVAPPPPPPPPPPPAAAPVKVVKVQTELINNQLRQPTKIPDKVKIVKEDEAPPQTSVGVVGGVPGGMQGGSLGGVLGGIVSSSSLPPPKVATPQKIRVSSGVAAGNLVQKVQPQYPAIAKTARIQGTVVLEATISKSGAIEGLKAVSGPPMLYQAAIDAVRQWRYKPYMLNGEPVEVGTTINVVFTLNGG
jgi:periplasmic protein TonB